MVFEPQTYGWTGEKDDHIRFLEAPWWLKHGSFTFKNNRAYDTQNPNKNPWVFTIFFVIRCSSTSGTWQVVIPLDPLDTGAEAFTLTAP